MVFCSAVVTNKFHHSSDLTVRQFISCSHRVAAGGNSSHQISILQALPEGAILFSSLTPLMFEEQRELGGGPPVLMTSYWKWGIPSCQFLFPSIFFYDLILPILKSSYDIGNTEPSLHCSRINVMVRLKDKHKSGVWNFSGNNCSLWNSPTKSLPNQCLK